MSAGRELPRRLFAISGLAALARWALVRGGRFALTFHGIASRRYGELAEGLQPSFAAAELDSALTWLGKRFAFLTPEQFFAGKRRGVLLTFDDGFANNRAQALPILRRHRAPAVFFVTTQHVLEPKNWLPSIRRNVDALWPDNLEMTDEVARDLFDGMSADELRECSADRLITIGGHSTSHPFLTRLDDDALVDELVESKRTLEDLCGISVDLLAYPTGDYDQRVVSAAEAAGYRAAFSEGSRSSRRAHFDIPRVGLYDARPWYLAAKLSGLHRAPIRGAIW